MGSSPLVFFYYQNERKNKMKLKGKAETDDLIAKISEIYSGDGVTPIFSENDSPAKGWGYLARNVLRARWMEDENGRKQGISQHFNYLEMSKDDVLLPGQEEAKGDTNGSKRSFKRYLERTVSYKDNVQDGPEIVYNPNGTIWSLTPYSYGQKNGLGFTVDSAGKTHYTLFVRGEQVADDSQIRKTWKDCG